MIYTLPIADVISAENFYARTQETTSGCLEWIGSIDSKGYGRVKSGGREYKAHRVALVLAGVDLPADGPVDHLCRNTRCVRVEHLEPTTMRENTARGIGPTAAAIRAHENGTCINGHVLAEVGLHKQRDGFTCAQCGRDRVAAYKARRAA